jgi:hypothetical protein
MTISPIARRPAALVNNAAFFGLTHNDGNDARIRKIKETNFNKIMGEVTQTDYHEKARKDSGEPPELTMSLREFEGRAYLVITAPRTPKEGDCPKDKHCHSFSKPQGMFEAMAPNAFYWIYEVAGDKIGDFRPEPYYPSHVATVPRRTNEVELPIYRGIYEANKISDEVRLP